MIDEQDKKVLEKQLGREPRSVKEIIKRCQLGYPQVLVTEPILDSNDKSGIFPTSLWLTCPELNYRISQLETKGLVQEIQNKIKDNSNLSKKLSQAHKNYAQYRSKLIDRERLEKLKNNNLGQYKVVTESGVGGIMEFSGIKCLHTHYAHYLIDDNPVGKIVDEILTAEYPPLDPLKCYVKCKKDDNNENRSN